MTTVCVLGCDFHLGPVVAAMLADLRNGNTVVGHAKDEELVRSMRAGNPPISEPGLADKFKAGLADRKLRFTSSYADSVVEADIVVVAFDTPVNDLDEADPEFVIREVEEAFPFLNNGQTVVLMSQLPVGSCARLERAWDAFPDKHKYSLKPVTFAVLPENLRLGTAIKSFNETRWIVGTRAHRDDDRIVKMLGIGKYDMGHYVSPEEAEFTKHARNAVLATNIALGNELAVLAAKYGADAEKVIDCVRMDGRIGNGLPLKPGGPIAGGTLLRDISYISQLAATAGIPATVTNAVRPANEHHKGWLRREILEAFDSDLRGKQIDIWGKSYKAGSDTNRRSYAIELKAWLEANGATVYLYDADALPSVPAGRANASGVVLYNVGPDVKKMKLADFPARHIFDPSGLMPHFLPEDAAERKNRYHRVGAPK